MRRIIAGLILVLAGCAEEPSAPPAHVARVGDQYLTQEEVADALEDLPIGQDSVDARQQLVERWITNELLYQEALRRGLREDDDVQRLLHENERSVLISALVSTLYDQETIRPTQAEIETYFERNVEQLSLREPFVRIRHLTTTHPDSAALARDLLQTSVRAGEADSVWFSIAARFARHPETSVDRSSSFYPEARVLADVPEVQSRLARMADGEIAPVLTSDSLYHVLQLVRRAPAGSTPELEWIEDELRQRLVVQMRKQMYARQVERLRNEARSRNALTIR